MVDCLTSVLKVLGLTLSNTNEMGFILHGAPFQLILDLLFVVIV